MKKYFFNTIFISIFIIITFSACSQQKEQNKGENLKKINKVEKKSKQNSKKIEKNDKKGENIVTKVGYLARMVMQHPILSSPMNKTKQFYFDIGDKPKSMNQIIVIYKEGMKIPRNGDKKIELKGVLKEFSAGGKTGTKGEYRNNVLYLKSWKYID